MQYEDYGDGDESSVPLVSPHAQSYPYSTSAQSQLEDTTISDGSDPFLESYHASNATQQTGTSYSHPSQYTRTSNTTGMISSTQDTPSNWFRHDAVHEDSASDYPDTRSSEPQSNGGHDRNSTWQRMNLAPRVSTHDPLSDATEPSGVLWSASPVNEDHTTHAYTPNKPARIAPPQLNSTQSSPHTSAHDYDPERHALDSTPGNLYSHKYNHFPRSRSPTPAMSPSRPSLPSTLPTGLTRRVLSSKENTPPRSRAYQYAEAGFEPEPEPVAIRLQNKNETKVPIGSPVAGSTTQHFGLPPRKQRRRYQEGAKTKIPLIQ